MWWPGTLVQVSLFRYVVRTRRLYSFHWILDTHALLTQQKKFLSFFFFFFFFLIYIFGRTLFKATKLSFFLKEDTLTLNCLNLGYQFFEKSYQNFQNA